MTLPQQPQLPQLLLQPLFQLLYLIVHFLYSLAQSLATTIRILPQFVPQFPARTGDSSIVPPLAKTPRHVGVVLGCPRVAVAPLAALLARAATYGAREVTVYDCFGDLTSGRQADLMVAVEKVGSSSAYQFQKRESGAAPSEPVPDGLRERVSQCEPVSRCEPVPDGLRERMSRCEPVRRCEPVPDGLRERAMASVENEPDGGPCQSRPMVTVSFLGLQEGRPYLARVAERLALRYSVGLHKSGTGTPIGLGSRTGKFLTGPENFPVGLGSPGPHSKNSEPRPIGEEAPVYKHFLHSQDPIGLPSARDIAAEMCLGLSDPELVLTVGLNSTLGFPPWLVWAAEIHSIDLGEGWVGLGSVMEAYAGCEQRWGR